MLIRRSLRGRDTFAAPARVAKFVVVCVGLATVTSASVGVITLCMTGIATVQNSIGSG